MLGLALGYEKPTTTIQIWDTGLSGGIPNFKTLVSMWILKKNQISDPAEVMY
jgi:hypothetical protein